MSNYKKPVISIDNGLAEGVYAASGCYSTTAYIHQTPRTGRGDYRIQVNGKHSSDHTKESQILTISFNQNVTICKRRCRSCQWQWHNNTYYQP